MYEQKKRQNESEKEIQPQHRNPILIKLIVPLFPVIYPIFIVYGACSLYVFWFAHSEIIFVICYHELQAICSRG